MGKGVIAAATGLGAAGGAFGAQMAAAAAPSGKDDTDVPNLQLDGTEMKAVKSEKKRSSKKSPRSGSKRSPRKKKINDILTGLDNEELQVEEVDAPALPAEEVVNTDTMQTIATEATDEE